MGRSSWPKCATWIKNVPDYDRALTELAAFLQRIAMVQIVPDVAAQDEEFDSDELRRLAAAILPEDAQLYYQIALHGRRDLSMAPEPRVGFEMTLLRMWRSSPIAAAQPTKPGPRRPRRRALPHPLWHPTRQRRPAGPLPRPRPQGS